MKDVVQSIINSGRTGFMVITGGGTGAISELLKYGGGSKFLIAGVIPYSASYFKSWTQRERDFCSLAACKDLVRWGKDECDFLKIENTINVGVTAKLCYDGEREGREHHAYIGYRDNKDSRKDYYKWTLNGTTNRESQEYLLTQSIICYLAKFMGLGDYSFSCMEQL